MKNGGVVDILIEEALSKFETHIIDYATIKSILLRLGYVNFNDKINQLKLKGIIKPIKKGLYAHTSLINNNIISKEVLSNNLYGPSYISLDYALYFHGLIPENVHQVTAITTKRSKIFRTSYGVFSYKQIKKQLFLLGVDNEKLRSSYALIASREKALCDKLYLTKGLHITSRRRMLDFIENDLRIDIDELHAFDIEVVSEYFKITKSRRIGLLLSLIHDL